MSRSDWPRAILYDLDGTLADSAPDIADALNAVLLEEKLDPFPLDAVIKMVGGGVSLLIERALTAHGVDSSNERVAALLPRFLEFYTPNAANKTKLFPGVLDMLELCRREGRKQGVCTNKPEAITREMLDALGIAGFFEAVIGGDTLPVKKPDPAPMLKALELLDAKPDESLMVGDSGGDADAARAAGLPVILVTFGYTRTPVEELHHDALANSFTELPMLIKELRKSRARS